MPTTNPRVNVTLSPSLDLLLSRLGKLERTSKSQVLRELLEAAEPALQRAVATMELAMKTRIESRAGFRQAIDKSQELLEEQLEANLALLEAHSRDLVSTAQSVRGRRPARKTTASAPAALREVDPPPSNRGVKSKKSEKTSGNPLEVGAARGRLKS
jgi:hypothetical protein